MKPEPNINDGATVEAKPGGAETANPPPHVGGSALPDELRRGKKYEIGRVVARGGMGAILDAKETAIERTVAMKVVLDAESPDALARFVTEGKVTGQLEHPNIVPVHELGVDEQQQVFYTMKFVRGDTLRKVLEQLAAGDAETIKKYPLSHLLTIFQKVCDAMAFAHSKGVIHRDLKPENIMLGDFGEVLVMDWGLAKVIGHREQAAPEQRTLVSTKSLEEMGKEGTMAGTIMGTPQYMPPEQAHGRIEQLDARSDIYSLGAILYHILTLQASVTGDNVMQVLFKVCNAEIVPPAESSKLKAQSSNLPHLLGGRVPESLSAVVMKAMALKQEDRYQSVPELQRDIEAYQNGFATSAEHASLLRQLVLLIKRHKAVFGTAFAAGILIAMLTVWFIINLRASERAARAAEAVAVQEKEAARQALAKSQLALAEAAFREQDGPGMQAALNGVPEDLRDSNWKYLLAQSDTSVATLRLHSTGIIRSAVPHPKKPGVFAIVGSDAWVALVEARTGARLMEFQVQFKDKGNDRYCLAFSPDGERLAIGRNSGGIVICGVRDGRKLAEWASARITRLEFSPNGQQLLGFGISISSQTCLWDAATGRPLWSRPEICSYAVFHPGGQLVLAAYYAEKLKLLNAKDGTVARQLTAPRNQAVSLAINPTGTRMWLGDNVGFVRCLDLKDGHVLYEIQAGNGRVMALAYIPDNNRLVTLAALSGRRDSVQVWDADTGGLLQSLLGSTGGGYDLSVHPLSGELNVAGSSISKVWDLAGRREKWRIGKVCTHGLSFWHRDNWLLGAGLLLDLENADSVHHPIWRTASGGYAVDVSADGRFAAVAHGSREPYDIHFLRTNGERVEEIHSFRSKHNPYGIIMSLSPRGERLCLGNCIVDPATGAELLRLKVNSSGGVACWPNSTQVVTAVTAKALRGQPGSEEQIVLWDANTGKALQTVVYRSVILAIATAPDGKTIAEAGADKMVRLRDAGTLAVTREFRAHNGSITALAFHPHRPILATCSEDLAIKLWDLNADRLLEELRGPLAAPQSLSFSPSGRRLACGTKDHSGWVWEPESLNPDAAAKAKRLEDKP